MQSTANFKTSFLSLIAIKPFLSHLQYAVLAGGIKSVEEKAFFQEKVIEMADIIENMPKTYEQDGKGNNANVILHYFYGCFDWYIIEKDMDDGVTQAFGLVYLGPNESGELGYISITEIVSIGAELDLHFECCTVGEIKQSRKVAA